MKARKKPVVIDALLWTGSNVHELAEWAAYVDLDHRRRRGTVQANVELPIDIVAGQDGRIRVEIKTDEGTMLVSPGDYILCGVKGEFYPCKPDVFKATYDEIDDGGYAAHERSR